MNRVAIALVLVASTSVARAQSSQLFDSGAVANGVVESDGRWYTLEVEASIHADVNGDGDQTDQIVRMIDPVARTVTNLPFAMYPSTPIAIAAGGDFQVLAIHESDHFNVDWNGDGDKTDDVLCVRRISTGAATIFPIAVFPTSLTIASDGSIAAFRLWEVTQGVDLNADGDKNDCFVAALVPATGALSLVGEVVVSNVKDLQPLANGGLLFEQPEASLAQDLNGDGDTADVVPRLFDVATNLTTTIALAMNSPASHAVVLPGEQQLEIDVSESAQGGVDRDGDGDASDVVPAVFDRATQSVLNPGIAGFASQRSLCDATHLVVVANESQRQHDDNGDGDQSDFVPWVVDLASGVKTNLAMAIPVGTTPQVGAGYVAFETIENFASPMIDWNGDGDTFDRIAVVHEFASGVRTVIPLGLTFPIATRALEAVESDVFLVGDEAANAFTDFNFDSTVNDRCAFVFEVSSHRLMNLGRSVSDLGKREPGEPLLGFLVSESVEGGQSLNGDADATDVVAMTFDSAANSLFETRLASYVGFDQTACAGRVARISVNESAQGSDRNGDGLLTQTIAEFYTPQPFGCGRFAMYGTGCPTSAGSTPELDAHGCAISGGAIRLQVTRGIPGQNAFLVLGAQQASLPLPGGCTLLAAPVLPFTFGPIFLPSNGLMLGARLIETTLPIAATPGAIRVQAFITDPIWPKGYSVSNGLELEVAP